MSVPFMISWGIVLLVIACLYADVIARGVRDVFNGLVDIPRAVFAPMINVLQQFWRIVCIAGIWAWHPVNAYLMAVGGWAAQWLDYGDEGRRHRARNVDDVVTVAHLLTGMDREHPYIVPTRHAADRTEESDTEVDMMRWNGADEEFIAVLHEMNLAGVGIHGDASL